MSREQPGYRPAGKRVHRQQDRRTSKAGDRGVLSQAPARRDDVFPVAVSGSRSRYQILVICGLLLLAVGLVFGQTVRHEFVNFDDPEYVCENPQVSAGLTAHGITWAFTQSHGANWIPVTWVSLMLDCQLYGLNAGGHHLTNVLLHAVTVVLLFLVLQWMTGCLWPSALVAVLFAVHPLRVESVAWVTERKDVLSGLFFMLTLGAYVGYARHRFSLGRYLAVMVFFALGLMAKATLVTLPLVLLLLDYWPLGRTTPAATRDTPVPSGGRGDRFALLMRLLLEKVPLLALVAVSCVVTVWAQREALVPIEQLPLWWRMGNALVSYVTYLGQFFYPVGLAVLYPRPSLDLPFWKVFGALLVLVSITAGSAALAAQVSVPAGGLAVVLGNAAAGDRASAIWSSGGGRPFQLLAADRLVHCHGVGGGRRLPIVAISPLAVWRHFGVGPGRLHGLCVAPDIFLARQRDPVDTRPGMYFAKFYGPRQPWLGSGPPWTGGPGHCPLPEGAGNQARLRTGAQQPRRGSSPPWTGRRGDCPVSTGRRDQAQRHESTQQPCYGSGCPGSAQRGHDALSEGAGNQARLRRRPQQPGLAAGDLSSRCAAQRRRGGPTCPASEPASDSKRPGILDTLSAAYAEAGRFPEALAAARKALEIAVQQNNRPLVDALRAHIALYEAGRPYHQTPAASTPPPKP